MNTENEKARGSAQQNLNLWKNQHKNWWEIGGKLLEKSLKKLMKKSTQKSMEKSAQNRHKNR